MQLPLQIFSRRRLAGFYCRMLLFAVLVSVCSVSLRAASLPDFDATESVADISEIGTYTTDDNSSEQVYRPFVSHPQRHHHIVRRRVSSHDFLKNAPQAGEEAPIVHYNDRAGQCGYTSLFLRPSYYVFLFRYTLF